MTAVAPHQKAGCLVPERTITLDNYTKYVDRLKVSKVFEQNAAANKPSKMQCFIDDGVNFKRGIKLNVKVYSEYGIGSSVTEEDRKSGKIPERETFSLGVMMNHNPELNAMLNALDDNFFKQLTELSPIWKKRQLSEDAMQEKYKRMVRPPTKESSLVKYGLSCRFEVYPDNKNLRQGWKSCTFEDLYDETTHKGKKGIYHCELSIPYVWILDNLGPKLVIDQLNFEALPDDSNAFMQDAVSLGWAPSTTVEPAVPTVPAGGSSNDNERGIEHEILKKPVANGVENSQKPDVSQAKSPKKRAREEDPEIVPDQAPETSSTASQPLGENDMDVSKDASSTSTDTDARPSKHVRLEEDSTIPKTIQTL